ncbi:MAG: protoporphyrinogen oxidase [Deltaproteobacteria bacterium]|nr:protoporphyrinogen oxidase [Deltaproteobacteria bacterium]
MEIVVIGGGISGLSTAYAIEQEALARGDKASVRVFEADGRLGGKIDTRTIDGFVIEGGVNGWLDSKPATDELTRALGIYDERLVSNDAARRRFILRRGRLQEVPTGPGAFLKSGLLSPTGKLRLALEPWARKRPDADESLADFARRRLGPEALEALLDPMVSGIFAGDPERMSLKSCFPRIFEIEAAYGGLIRGMIKIQKERAALRKKTGSAKEVSAAGPGGKLISFAPGTSRLIESLRARLRVPPVIGAKAASVVRAGAGYKIRFADGQAVDAEKVVLATPAYAASQILRELDAEIAHELAGIPYAAVSVVALAWRRADMPHPLDGFGFVVPFAEGEEILGTLWDSSVFANRAPEGQVLLRSMVGGFRRGALALRGDDEIISSVVAVTKKLTGVEAVPRLAKVIRHERAIPQYVLGHGDRLARIDARLARHDGLLLTGNAYHGVGLNDCTANAKRIATAVFEAAAGRGSA